MKCMKPLLMTSPAFYSCSHFQVNPVLSLYLKGNTHHIFIPLWDKLMEKWFLRPCQEENCKPFVSTCTQCSNNQKPAGEWGECSLKDAAVGMFTENASFTHLIWFGQELSNNLSHFSSFHITVLQIRTHQTKQNIFSALPVCVGVGGWVGWRGLKIM